MAVLAIGSPFGADRIGWQIGEHLALHGQPDVHLCRHPIDLLPYFARYPHCCVIDALWADSLKGSQIIQLKPDDLQQNHCPGSHGLTLYDVIQLAKISGQLPEQIQIIGINISKRSYRDFTGAEVASLVDRLCTECSDFNAVSV